MSLPQPVPPSWKDLGKNSADLLGKDYPVAGAHIDIKTKTPNGITFKIVGDRDSKNLITGDIETKYTDFKNGLTLTQTWTTANALKTAVELENYGTNGLKLDVATSLQADKMTKGAVFSATYKQPGIHSRISLDAVKGPTCTVETAFGLRGFVLGSEAAYNVGEGKVLRYGLGTCFNAPSYAATILALNNCKTFTASYYHRVSSDVEAGARATYDNKNPSAVNLEVGTKA
ncbi:hypothetical protein Clacol_009845 [Clathrus columnatus]|uniref:Voltage-dependent anion-selective channel n=1 Tax=Clathrus columnatus TaxID=1419009 RepID=A0AAV5AP66_9AGAM|nr:hypothetical protein Clacol_009845 [Clathrus columnatus]